MVKQILSLIKVSKAVWIFFFLLIVSAAKADSLADTTKKKLLAAASAKDAGFVTLEPNVVFPDVLAGNEENALDYIEKFSTNRRAYLIRTYNRSKKYFPKFKGVRFRTLVV